MSRSNVYAALVLLVILAACQSPAPSAQSTSSETPARLAARALAAGRYADAALLYREALGEASGKMELHYGLAVASSYLDRRDDAIREFRWVLRYGPPNSAEVEASRQWLTRAGALPPATYAATNPSRPEKERTAGNASLEGRAVFGEGGQSPQPMERLQLFLVGQPNSPTQRERYNLRTDEHGNFKFPDVVPGPYKLTNRVAGQPIWRLRVEFKPSEVKVLELTPANSLASVDDFPEQQVEAKQ
jgi:tetratricopeptide (TPR) repeat protein